MEKTLSVLLMALFLLVGVVGGALLAPQEVEIKEVVKEVSIEVPTEVVVEIPVADASEYLSAAVEDFMEYVDDEELFVCDSHEYNFDEITVSRIYDEWNLEFDDTDYTVNFDIKLEFDEDDEKSCKERFEVEAFYEENEDIEFSIV